MPDKQKFRYLFTGQANPIASDVNIGPIHYKELIVEQTGDSFNIFLHIINSKVKALVITTAEDLLSVRNLIEIFVNDLLSIVAFTHLVATSAQIDYVYNLDTGKEDFFLYSLSSADFLDKNNKDEPVVVDKIWNTIVGSKYHTVATLALNNFRRAIIYPNDTAFFTYRSIESIKRHFDGKDKKSKWENMRSSLNLTKEYIKICKEAGDEQRHGNLSDMISWEHRKEQLNVSWTIINRFLHFIANKEQTLDREKFPLK